MKTDDYRIRAINNPTGQRLEIGATYPAGTLEVKGHTCKYDEKAKCYRVTIEFGKPKEGRTK
jgi:hypothetical protein